MRRLFVGLTLSLAAGAWPALASADNTEFSQSIATALRESGRLTDYSVGVASENGVVQLDGRVASQEQLQEAIEMTSAMPGVSKVVNNLQVKPSAKKSGAAKFAAGSQQTAGSGIRKTSYPDPSTPAATSGGNDLVSKLRAGRTASTATTAAKKQAASRQASQPNAQQVAMQQAAMQQAMAQQMAMQQQMQMGGGGPQGMQQGMPRALPPQQGGQMPPQRMAMNPVGMAAGMGAGAAGMAMGAAGMAMGGPGMANCPPGMGPGGGGMGGPGGMGMGGPGMGPGGPMPMGAPSSPGGVRPAGYDQPNMPNHAWPSYAAYPNYAAVTYPRQYSPTAWPYIGPFYPYPQVPLGWRKVTLEWDDGWWMLNFKD